MDESPKMVGPPRWAHFNHRWAGLERKAAVSQASLSAPVNIGKARGEQEADYWPPDPLIKSQGQRDQNRTLTRKPNHFEARLLFLRQWKVYVLPRFRHKTLERSKT
jgi:hypothetical protein